MLGWYGLQDSGNSNNSISMYDKDMSPGHAEGDTGLPYKADIPDEHHHHQMLLKDGDAETEGTNATACTNTIIPTEDNDIDFKDKVNRWNGLSIQGLSSVPIPLEGIANQPQSGINQDKKIGGRKLIGMRYLFPPPPDGLSLLEKARIWVARHDYKYFVGWNEQQLSRIDPALRPICVITPDLYKTHMNRSEYCRNVKLKYCLESEAEWAQEFREKLAKPYNKGGFSGLCQAKIVAAELWRKHSENYKSHQARYPNPKSKYRARRMSMTLQDQHNSSQAENMYTVSAAEFTKYNQDLSQVYSETDIKDSGQTDFKSVYSTCDGSRDSLVSGNITTEDAEQYSETGSVYSETDRAISKNINVNINYLNLPNNEPENLSKPKPEDLQSQQRGYSLDVSKSQQDNYASKMCDSFVPVPSSWYNKLTNQTSTEQINMATQIKKTIGGRNNDYRKSERGLSYLFPSLIDQQLSLLDKVRITVLRHKNNYFLSWNEEQLKKVDPLVRPKMPVTRELYKEYCHRNAMKYDSNLQFAMESEAKWAVEFRERLIKPPNEGGFHSLCEVKQEAGRLWKEYSGRYKMHNVVKAQMDMNNEQAKTPASLVDKHEPVCGPHFDDTSDLRSTASSPGPRLDMITSPTRKFISRSANSSPTLQSEEQIFRYPAAGFPIHSRKRKQSDDSGCSSLPSPTHGMVEPDIYKLNCDKKTTYQPGITGLNGIAHQEAMYNDSYLHSKIPKLTRLSTTLEVSNCMLFAPLPPELSVANQLIIWLQRHQNNYFIGWTQNQIDKLNPFLRPLYVVTPDVLKSHISPTMFAMFDKAEEIMTSEFPWGKSFKTKLGLPPGKGGFATIKEALAEVIDIWKIHCQPKVSPSLQQEKEIPNPGLLKLRNMFKAKSMAADQGHSRGTLSTATAETEDPNNTLEGLLHPKQVGNNDEESTESNGFQIHEAALDLSNKSSLVSVKNNSGKDHDASTGNEPAVVANLINTLWSCRQQLQNVCKDSVALSWQERLYPHLGLLREKLSDTYELPNSVSDCMVDLMLVLLHENLTQNQ